MISNQDIMQALRVAAELQQQGRGAEAERIYRDLVARAPNQADALHVLGIFALRTGQAEKAVEILAQAIAANPNSAPLRNDMGVALRLAGQIDQAIAEHRKAVAIDPQLFNARRNLGGALLAGDYLDEAIEVLQAALKMNPTSDEAYNTMGIALHEAGRLDDSIAAFEAALHLQPNSVMAHSNLSGALMDCADYDRAMAHWDRAMALQPPNPGRLSGRIFSMHYHPRYEAADLLAAARQWDELFGRPLQKAIRPHSNDRTPDRKLRIGYLSADFRQHVIARAMLPLLASHDREQFEIYCYASVATEDAMTAKIRSHADAWRDISRMDDNRAAQIIRDDRIDILVDLALHCLGNRLPIFARKPAPVQISYLSYCSTSGLSAMDYRLSDPFIDLAEIGLSQYSEKTIRLPRTYLCYQPRDQTPAVSSPPCISEGAVTFGCLNKFIKCSSDALDLWMRILQAVPESRLILHAKSGRHLDRLRQRFGQMAVSPQRLEFVDRLDWPQYVATYNRIDIALDPFPYNGGVTTCDALWMGVPVVTLSGRTAVGRVGRSLLSNVGLTELIAQTPDQYVKIAVELAGDVDRLKQIRSELRERLQNSPMMDGRQLTRDIESAFRDAWRSYCKGE